MVECEKRSRAKLKYIYQLGRINNFEEKGKAVMYKNKNVCSVELMDISVETLVDAFGKGSDIVFITEKGNFRGGVTVGDMWRYFRNKQRNT